MSMECANCSEIFTYNGDTLECCTCKKNVHFYCIGITKSNFKKMSQNTKMIFSCQACLAFGQKPDKVI